MNLNELEFKAEDFEVEFHRDRPVPYFLQVAERANQLLRERLEKALKMDLTVDEYGMREYNDSGLLGTLSPTHTAKLVCIEEIEK